MGESDLISRFASLYYFKYQFSTKFMRYAKTQERMAHSQETVPEEA